MPRLNKTVYAKRQTNLSWAICSTLMCICFPIGLVAVLVALKSKRAWRDDRPETAGDMADMAKTIALIAILFSTIVICIFTALIASGYFYEFLNYSNIMTDHSMHKLLREQGEEPTVPTTTTTEAVYEYDYENIAVTDAPNTQNSPVQAQ